MRASMIPFLAAIFVLLSAAKRPPCPPDRSCPKKSEEPAICECHKGALQFNSSDGLVQGQVIMQQLHIANEARVEIPHKGFLIIQVRAGKLIAEVEGEGEKEWRVDSFWSVSAHQRLIVNTKRDSVVLQVVEFITQKHAAEEARKPAGSSSSLQSFLFPQSPSTHHPRLSNWPPRI